VLIKARSFLDELNLEHLTKQRLPLLVNNVKKTAVYTQVNVA